jgi:hypothetical protein
MHFRHNRIPGYPLVSIFRSLHQCQNRERKEYRTRYIEMCHQVSDLPITLSRSYLDRGDERSAALAGEPPGGQHVKRVNHPTFTNLSLPGSSSKSASFKELQLVDCPLCCEAHDMTHLFSPGSLPKLSLRTYLHYALIRSESEHPLCPIPQGVTLTEVVPGFDAMEGTYVVKPMKMTSIQTDFTSDSDSVRLSFACPPENRGSGLLI